MYENRKKKIAKEKYVVEKTNYNYIRLTNKDFSQLMAVFADLKLSLNEYDKKRVIHINENNTLNETMAGSLAGALPPMSASDSGVYVINHLKNTAFSPSTNLAVSDTPKFDTIYTIVDGYLRKKDKKYLKECKYSTYFVDNCKESVKEYCKSHLDAPASNDELYYSIFGHDCIYENQITFEDAAIEYEDINIQEQRLSEFVTNYITKGE